MLCGEQRQHDQPGHDERAIGDAVDLGHPRPDRRAEHDEIERGGDDRRHQALPQRAQRARHLEAVDRPDAVEVEAADAHCAGSRSVTRLTKMSSSELCLVLRSLKPMPSVAHPPEQRGHAGSLGIGVEHVEQLVAVGLRGRDSSRPAPAGSSSSGSVRLRVSSFLPSFFISAVFSSTRISSPLLITPTRSAISSASSI